MKKVTYNPVNILGMAILICIPVYIIYRYNTWLILNLQRCTLSKNNLFGTFLLAIFLLIMTLAFQYAHASNHLDSQSNEPIAYIGHGAMFDKDGKEIQVTQEFIKEAQKFYLDTLLKQADENQIAMFEQKQKRLFSGQQWDDRSELYARSALIEWLINEIQHINADKIYGNLKLLGRKLTSPDFQIDSSIRSNNARPFELPDALKDLLFEEGLTGSEAGSITLFSTTLGGAAYLAECNNAGVPTPPDWGTNQWVSRGVLNDEFISASLEAEVFTYESSAPEGVCIALPRSQGNTISLLGIICLGKTSSNACFWDNQQNDQGFEIQKGTVVSINQFAGGGDLFAGSGGVCTDCHAGENPYVIHPNTALGLPNLSDLTLKADNWYKPLVHPNWPQNAVPSNVNGTCNICHVQNGPGGRFPNLSTQLPGYCGSVLQNAINRTMPPNNPGDPEFSEHANALLDACRQPDKLVMWVDFSHNGNESGAPSEPFNTLVEGVDAISPQGQIFIRKGFSSETIKITKPLTLQAADGTVTIGLQ